MGSLFVELGQVADRVASTSSRLEKAKRVGDYLSALGDDDLRRAVTWLCGTVFPLCDQRTVQIGGSSLFRLLEEVTGVDPQQVRQHMVRLGDLGDLAFLLYEAVPHLREQSPTLTLAEAEAAFARLSAISGNKQRSLALLDLLIARTSLEVKYLVKLLAGDLRIGLKEGALEDALARLYATSVERIQWTHMLLGDLGETAVLARHGTLDTARMRLFHPLKFMLATPAADVSDVARQMPVEFVVEDKYDGIRAQLHLGRPGSDHHGRTLGETQVAIFSRTLDDITGSFPELVEASVGLAPDGVILDGEIVVVAGDSIRPFADLQTRLGRKVLSASMLAQNPVAYVAYDLFYDGEVCLEAPFHERRARLERLPLEGPVLRRAPSRRFQDVQELEAEFAAARARGNEGLMVKDPGSPYRPGRRGREWLKIKRPIATLDVVVTSVEVGHGRRARVYSDYTFAVRKSDRDDTLLNVGKAYTGLTDKEIEDLSAWFVAHTVEAFGHGRVRIVEPRVVLEITFDAVHASTRHKSGYALRFPRIVRVRTDKPVGDIDTVETVRRLAEATQGEANAGDADPILKSTEIGEVTP